jgi:hypothetical protein
VAVAESVGNYTSEPTTAMAQAQTQKQVWEVKAVVVMA